MFNLKLGNQRNAENQLYNLIHPVIVQAMNRLTVDDFISNKRVLNAALREGFTQIDSDMTIRCIQLQDIQVHRSILPNANAETTYDRLKADHAKASQQLRSESEQSYQMVVSDTDLQASVINAYAVPLAGGIRGGADSQALKGTLKENSTLALSQNFPLWQNLLKWGFGKAGN